MSLPGKEPPPQMLEHSQTDAEGWERCEGLQKAEAEKLLDWLEAHGFSQREVSCTEEGKFTVRWRKQPPNPAR